jgi:hypothetical protein
MDLQNFIYLLFCLVWLSGLIWAGVIAFRSRRTNDKTTLKNNESLNVNVGKMSASKLTTIDLRKDKR